MNDETIDDLCKDCGPTFTAFLEKMAAHNKEQIGELTPKVVCPTCGKVHEYTYPSGSKTAEFTSS